MLEYIDDDVLEEHSDLLESFLDHDDSDVRQAVESVLPQIRADE